MTHFAKIDDNNIVIQVLVIEQEMIDTGRWGDPNSFIQTSYNTKQGKHEKNRTPLRGNYAGIGYTYDRVNDLFLPPKPYESFVLDVKNATWTPPTNMPLDGQLFKWDETTKAWKVAVKRNAGIEFE